MEQCTQVVSYRSTFTANLANTLITDLDSRNLLGLMFGTDGLQTSATAPTIAAALGIWNAIVFTLGKRELTRIDGTTMAAYNMLALHHYPHTEISAGNTQTYLGGGWWFPTQINADPSRAGYIASTYAAVTNGATTVQSINALSLATPFPNTVMKMNNITLTTSGTASGTLGNVDYPFTTDGALIGVLINETTVAGGATAATAGTIREFGLQVGSNLLTREDFQTTIQGRPNATLGTSYNALRASPADITIIDNFVWLPMPREPIPAGTPCKIKINAGVTAETVTATLVQLVDASTY